MNQPFVQSVIGSIAKVDIGLLERINWLGDNSENGMTQSMGLMVNYLYDLKHIEVNHELFVKQNEIITSNQVKPLLK